jgi:NitT/TauT family transport system substrate-binding protein
MNQHRENDARKRMAKMMSVALPLLLFNSAGHAAELTTVRLSMQPVLSSAPIVAADQLGYFEAEGLKVDVTPTSGGAVGLPALIGGSLDFVISNIVSIVLAVNQGLDIKVIAANSDTGPGAPDTSAVVVKADSEIKGAADLVGKRLAVNARNGLNWLYAKAWIAQSGADPDKVTYVEVPFPQMNDAVVNNQADAAYNVDPFVDRGKMSGETREIGRPFADVQDSVPKSQIVATGSFIESNPDVVERFTRAYKRGVEWMNDHRGQQGWADMVAVVTKLKPEIIMKGPQPMLPTSISVEESNRTVALMVKFGLIDKPIDFAPLLYKTATE